MGAAMKKAILMLSMSLDGFFEGPNGGAVFSVGSISWCGSLSANSYDNDVSQITQNVLERFKSEQPFRLPFAGFCLLMQAFFWSRDLERRGAATAV